VATPSSRPLFQQPVACTVAGMAGNVLLTVTKLVVGLAAGSAALVADGFHSLSDLAGDVGVLVALRASAAPPDHRHPYGHHNFETLGAMAASLLLLATGVLMGREAVTRLLAGQAMEPGGAALAVALVSVVLKEAMARYTAWVGRLNRSPALKTNAAHHRSDALSSLAAAVGILGARLGHPAWDGLAALLISAWIVWMGWDLLRENTDILLEARPDEELMRRVDAVVASVPGVTGISRLRVRPRGSIHVVDVDVTVPPRLTVAEGHRLAHTVESRLREEVPGVIGANVHVEPDPDDPLSDDAPDAPAG